MRKNHKAQSFCESRSRRNERGAALAIEAQVPAGRRVERHKLETAVGERLRNESNLVFIGVVEVRSSSEDLQARETRLGNLREQSRRQLFGNEQVGGQDSFHGDLV